MKPIADLARQLSFATGMAAALSISGCGPSPTAGRVCTNAAGQRINDAGCQRTGGRGGAFWYYGGRGRATGFGERVSGGSRVAPARGGFGSFARGSGGG